MPNNARLKIENNQKLKASGDPSLVEPGNLDLTKRPKFRNPDGSYSTVYSYTFPIDGPEGSEKGKGINVPGLIRTGARPGSYLKVPEGEKGRQMAWKAYQRTGEHLGIHKTLTDADNAAKKLHIDQQNMYGK